MKYLVIGWTSIKSNDFLLIDEINDEIKEAISKDIKSHHYLFNAYDHLNKDTCVPVLNNYRKVVLEKDEFKKWCKKHYDKILNWTDKVLKYETDVIVERMKKREFPFQAEEIKRYYHQFLKMTERR